MQLIQRLRDLHTDRAHAQRRLLFIRVTATPLLRAEAAISRPIQPPPTIASRVADANRCFRRCASLPVAQGIYLRMLPRASDGSRARAGGDQQ